MAVGMRVRIWDCPIVRWNISCTMVPSVLGGAAKRRTVECTMLGTINPERVVATKSLVSSSRVMVAAWLSAERAESNDRRWHANRMPVAKCFETCPIVPWFPSTAKCPPWFQFVPHLFPAQSFVPPSPSWPIVRCTRPMILERWMPRDAPSRRVVLRSRPPRCDGTIERLPP